MKADYMMLLIVISAFSDTRYVRKNSLYRMFGHEADGTLVFLTGLFENL